MLKVGETAPDFELQAFHQNTFKQINLTYYAGKWLILYFYPADFTFV
jgi:peroxiredoxin (alkyl hydroperoxide reductase subunit C)